MDECKPLTTGAVLILVGARSIADYFEKAGATRGPSPYMTKCVKVLRAKAIAKSMDHSQA